MNTWYATRTLESLLGEAERSAIDKGSADH